MIKNLYIFAETKFFHCFVSGDFGAFIRFSMNAPKSEYVLRNGGQMVFCLSVSACQSMCVSPGDVKGNIRRHKCDNKYHALYSSIDRSKQLNKNIFMYYYVHLFKTNPALAQLEYGVYVCDIGRERESGVGVSWVANKHKTEYDRIFVMCQMALLANRNEMVRPP